MRLALPPLIGLEQVALIARHVSIIVGSRDGALRPHVLRAVGCRLSADLRQVTVFVVASGSRAVLSDLADNGQVAVVFSEPTTHRTGQIKGNDAVVAAAAPDDAAAVDRYLQQFAEVIAQIGFTRSVAETATRSGAAAVPEALLPCARKTARPAIAARQRDAPGCGLRLHATA